jgi:hypothetical protein
MAMPIHDWTRVRPNRFHDFHQSWTIAIRNAVNAGLLAPSHFAMVEQQAGGSEPDVITPELTPPANPTPRTRPSGDNLSDSLGAVPGCTPRPVGTTEHAMTADAFRRLALGLPEAIESAHMGHPDFRVRGKIFATLAYPDESWAMVKLTVEQQKQQMAANPEVFAPVPGGWGRRGATQVNLRLANNEVLWEALRAAWRNVAPRRLVQENEAE